MFGPSPPERYEWWLYPILVILPALWKFYPWTFYWQNLWTLETLLFVLAGGLEVWHFHKKRPWVALIILMAMSGSLAFALLNQHASIKLLYWIIIGMFAYVSLLNRIPSFFGYIMNRLRPRR